MCNWPWPQFWTGRVASINPSKETKTRWLFQRSLFLGLLSWDFWIKLLLLGFPFAKCRYFNTGMFSGAQLKDISLQNWADNTRAQHSLQAIPPQQPTSRAFSSILLRSHRAESENHWVQTNPIVEIAISLFKPSVSLFFFHVCVYFFFFFANNKIYSKLTKMLWLKMPEVYRSSW